MVGAVPTTGGTGTQRGPVRCPYGPHTGKGAGHVPRPHRAPYSARTVARMGPVPFCPYRSRTVLPVPVPYHFALMLPLLPLAPSWTRLLAPGVFKLSCSTPFTLFLRLVSVYRSFQLYFIPKIISTIPLFYSSLLTAYFYLTSHSAVFIYISEGIELNFVFYHLNILHFEPWCIFAGVSACVHPLVGLGGGWGQNVTKRYLTYNGNKTPIQKKSTG